jgi:hypothetical protein
MSEAPETIWTDASGKAIIHGDTKPWPNDIKWVRADLHPTEAQIMAHPKVQALVEALLDHNELLRSAFQIAKREGVEEQTASTNWDAYYNRVAVVLKRHQETINAALAAMEPPHEH